MATISDAERLAKWEAQKDKIEKRIARHKAAQSKRTRKRDTRRKIIAGAFALTHCERDDDFRDALFSLLDKQLEKPQDRALFDLPPRSDGGV